jgi:FtsZ-interacting cell division protein ZipA
MSKDTVKLFQRARAVLQSEKDSLSKALANAQATAADAEKRLAEIEAALGGAGTAPAKRRGRKSKKAAGKRRGRPAKKTAGKRGRPAKKKAAKKAPRKAVKKAAKKTPRKAVKKAAKKTPRKAVKKVAKKAPKKAVKKAPKKAAKKASAKKVKNKLSLKQVALAVTKGKALDAKQILGAAKKAGHKFSGKNPLNSLRVMLYTNKKAFKNNKGKFVAA